MTVLRKGFIKLLVGHKSKSFDILSLEWDHIDSLRIIILNLILDLLIRLRIQPIFGLIQDFFNLIIISVSNFSLDLLILLVNYQIIANIPLIELKLDFLLFSLFKTLRFQ